MFGNKSDLLKVVVFTLSMSAFIGCGGGERNLSDTPATSSTPTTEPAPTEPAPTEPAPTEPAPTEPAPTEPAPTEPAPTEPAPTEPAPTEPAPTEPAPTEPAPTEPAPTEPAPTEPAPTEPAPTEPAPTEPAPTEPAPTEPAPTLSSVTLSWMPPSTYTDGSVLTNLSGHHIYINDGTGFVRIDTLTNPSISEFVVENLEPGTYTFSVTAFDSAGVESSYSNEATITVGM